MSRTSEWCHVSSSSNVERYRTLYGAWVRLEALVASGSKERLAIIQSPFAPNIPTNHVTGTPIPHVDGEDPLVPMNERKDYLTLHWDRISDQYYWESQHDGFKKDVPNSGRYLRTSSPNCFRKLHTIYLVVPITQEMEKASRGLPRVPWEEAE